MIAQPQMKSLEDCRKAIGEIDARAAELFEQRMLECRSVAEFKRAHALPVEDSAREEQLLRRNASLISDDTIREYYVSFEREVIALSKKYQERLMGKMRVAYCGIKGAFADFAVKRMFPEAEAVGFSDFSDAYRACEDGACDAVVLPIENSYAGEVSAVTDLMFSGSLYVNQVVEVEAVQNLLGCPGAIREGIREVVSHPQALSQCAAYIRERGYVTHGCHNTAAAAKLVAEKNDPTVAAIASEECARLYSLEVLDRRINAASVNTTRFAAFSRSLNPDPPRRNMDRHFILMFTVRNEAGSLAKTLNIIGAHGYNMSCLRSRPMKELMWNYYFYIELDGNVDTSEGRSMMLELGTICDKLKLVGAF